MVAQEYDYSAILYLNTQATDSEKAAAGLSSLTHFTGGSLVFLDSDCDRVVHPVAGRLVAFTSGFENPHQVSRPSSESSHSGCCISEAASTAPSYLR